MFDWFKKLRRAERKLMAWHAPGRPVWPLRDNAAFAREGYAQNAVAYRCVRLIAEAAASAPLKVGPKDHPLARLLARPNPEQTGVELLEAFFGHLQVSGNAYLEAASLDDGPPSELYVLRPDRMSVIPGADGWPVGWEHRVGASVRRFSRDPVTGHAPILHLKLFHASDARPHPAFPARADVWNDGANWRRGHWLNGRAGLSGLGEICAALCARAGFADFDVSGLTGVVNGYIVDAPSSVRDGLEPLLAAFDAAAAEREGRIVFFHRGAGVVGDIAPDELAAESVMLRAARAESAAAPIEARVRFIDPTRDYLASAVSARRLDRAQGGVATLEAPLVLEADAAEKL
ncbi:MAG TPA: phage portal protein, partial [Terricaulis sp.]|nr:phage portal protein [Terricaulis sp.]